MIVVPESQLRELLLVYFFQGNITATASISIIQFIENNYPSYNIQPFGGAVEDE